MEKVLRDTQIRSMHEMGEMKRAQELRVDEISDQKLRENHETNTKAHLSVARNARTDGFFEWFGRISRSGIESQWKIVLRSHSTRGDFKFSFHAEPPMSKISSDDVLESLCKMRIRESYQLKTVRHGNSSKDIDAQLSKIEDDDEEEYRSKTQIAKFLTPGTGRIETGAVVRNRKGIIGVEGGKGIC